MIRNSKIIKILLSSVLLTAILAVRYGHKRPPSGDSEAGPDPWPSEWFWLQRTFPHGTADRRVYREAMARAKEMKNRLAKRSSMDLWEFVGPTNIGGRVVDIEFDPKNPHIVYAAAATGGIFKSEDSGQTWRPIFDEMAVLTIGDLAVDPEDTEIIYAGTGEANGGHNNFPGGGIYKSVNGGGSWDYTGLEETVSTGRVIVDPSDTRRIFVAAVGSYFGPDSNRGVYISEDGGLSWRKSLFVSDSTGAIDLVMDPNNPDFMLAAMWERVRRPVYSSRTHLNGKTSGIYRTEDGGLTWQRLGPENGLPDAEVVPVGRIGLAMYPQNSDLLYCVYTDGTSISGLFASNDGGNTWTPIGTTNPAIVRGTTFSWYFGQIRVHPTDPYRLYVLDVEFMRSDDGGYTWPIIYSTYGGDIFYPDLHVDHHALAFHPENPDYVICGNDGGINISQDGGTSWSKVKNLPVTQFYEIALDLNNPEHYYGGTQDNGTIRTTGGGIDDWEMIYGGDGFYAIVNPDNADIIYAESQFGDLHRSTNGGLSFVTAINGIDFSEPTNWATPVVMDPHNSSRLYYGTDRLYRSENDARDWIAISADLTRNLPDSRVGTITTIAVAPSDSDVIYVGTDDGLVWVSPDFGLTWLDASIGLPFRWVTRIAVDPVNPDRAVVTFSGLKWRDPESHVFLTEDMGQSWLDISGDLPDAPVNAVAIDPLYTEVIYIGTDVGCFYTLDSGQHWFSLGMGLPVVVIGDMKINPRTYELIVGTYGRSMYKLDLEQITVGVGEHKPGYSTGVSPYRIYPAYPNPFNASTSIRYELSVGGRVELDIYNVSGHMVKTLLEDYREKGAYIHTWDGTGDDGLPVSSGVYYIHFRVFSPIPYRQTIKAILLK